MTRVTSTLLLCCALAAGTAHAQTPTKDPAALAAAKDPSAHGTVVTATRTTLVIRTGPETYQLFVFDRDTMRPPKIPPGASVTVNSRASDDPGAPFATIVKVTAMPVASPETPPAAEQEVVPPSVRRLEQSVERQARRFHLGARTGATLDQELFSLGAHTQIGPFFADRLYARPNFELGFGEVTTLIAFNFEGIYQLPVTQHGGRFNVYLGGGPALNFTDRGFETPEGESDNSLNRFDDFSTEMSFNILMGVQLRSGFFTELKAAAYAGPHIRFILGYNW